MCGVRQVWLPWRMQRKETEMRRSKRGTPFPTGLFKSPAFLERVAEMLDEGAPSSATAMTRSGVTVKKIMPKVALAKAKGSGFVEVIIDGKSCGRVAVGGKGAVASAVVLPKTEGRPSGVLRVTGGVAAGKVRKSLRGYRAAKAASARR